MDANGLTIKEARLGEWFRTKLIFIVGVFLGFAIASFFILLFKEAMSGG